MKRSQNLILMFFFFSFFMLSQGSTQVVEAKSFVSIGTHPIGSFFNSVGAAVAKVTGDHTKLKATVKPMKGPVAWYPYMERKAIDMGILNMWDAEKGWLGESIYQKLSREKGFSIRLMAVSVYNPTSFWVAKDSGIQSIPELKGKRVCGKYPTPSLHLQAESYLRNWNMTWDDVNLVPVNSISEGVRMVIEGRADATAAAMGVPVVEELNAKKGARMLALDASPEAVARSKAAFPGYPVKVSPGKGVTGVEKEQYVWAYDIYLICRENLAEEDVFNIVKALWENQEELGKIHKALKKWTTDRFVSKEALIPYHQGAINFFKEKGVWTEEMEALQAELLAKKPGK